jgi:hypothetical protein
VEFVGRTSVVAFEVVVGCSVVVFCGTDVIEFAGAIVVVVLEVVVG